MSDNHDPRAERAPVTMTDAGIPAASDEHSFTAGPSGPILAARRYDTFWSTGNEALARAALAHDFTDRTLPAGRPQGPAAPLAASKLMHAAIPDIRCEIEQMIVAGDRAVVHLHFRGHFTGDPQ